MDLASAPSNLARIADGETTLGLDPGELLARFTARRDEAAFAALVALHGPMVLATCRRILPERADADDAFQATFLVFARHARSIRDPGRLAPWLHHVARRVSVRARQLAARRRRVEGAEPGELAVGPAADDCHELRSVLDEELARLPARFRAPLVLCYLEGLTHDEAAGRLACPVGTVRSRLARGRDRLLAHLTRRGFGPSAVALPPTLPLAVVSRPLQLATVRLVCVAAAPSALAPTAFILARGVLTSMFVTKIQTATLATLTVAATLAAGTAGAVVARQRPAADVPKGDATPAAAPRGDTGNQPAQAVAPAAAKEYLKAAREMAGFPVVGPAQALDVLKERFRIDQGRIELAAQERRSRQPRQGPPEPVVPADLRRGITMVELEIAGAFPQVDLLDDDQFVQELQALRDRYTAELGAIRAEFLPPPEPPAAEVAALKARVKELEAELARQGGKAEPAQSRHEQTLGDLANLSKVLEAVTKEVMAPLPQVTAPAGATEPAPRAEEPTPAKQPGDPAQIAELTRRGEPLQQASPLPKPAAEPVARVETLKGSPTIVMAIPATRDRVTMIDLATQRRATLHLGRPMQKIRAVVNQADYSPMSFGDGETKAQRREKQMVDGLVGLELVGERVEKAAVFDRVAMEWLEHPLPRPAAHVRPDITPFSTLIGFGVRSLEPTAELLVFDARDRSWPTVPLPVPVAGFIPADVSIFGTVTFEAGRALAVYSQAAQKSGAVELARGLPPQWPDQAEQGGGVRRVNEKYLEFQDRRLVISDGPLIRIFDPATAEWTAINTDEK